MYDHKPIQYCKSINLNRGKKNEITETNNKQQKDCTTQLSSNLPLDASECRHPDTGCHFSPTPSRHVSLILRRRGHSLSLRSLRKELERATSDRLRIWLPGMFARLKGGEKQGVRLEVFGGDVPRTSKLLQEPMTLIRFQTKICKFHHPISHLIKKSLTHPLPATRSPYASREERGR